MQAAIAGKTVVKMIVVPGKLVNFVVRYWRAEIANASATPLTAACAARSRWCRSGVLAAACG